MAELLARTHSLVTLWVRLALRHGQATVEVRLDATVAGERRSVIGIDPIPIEAFGMGQAMRMLSTSRDLIVPPQLVETVADWHGREGEGAPLWIHLISPYGWLGVVPWERDFSKRLGVPVLRLPDFLEPARQRRSNLHVALVSCVPPGVGKGAVFPHEVEAVIEALLTSTSRSVLVHLFAEPQTAAAVEASGNSHVRVHAPSAGAAEAGIPWFDWIESARGAVAFDGVHFIAHAVMGSDAGLLALPRDPFLRDSGATYADHADVADLLNRVGAWAAGFHAPEQLTDDTGLRHLADAIGASRPGAVLYHDARVDPDALRDALALIYEADPYPPPVSSGLFFYVQPRRVRVGDEPELDSSVDATRTFAHWDVGLDPAYSAALDLDEVPAVVGATERFVEQMKWRLARNEDDDDPTSVLSDEEADALDSTVGQIKAIVAEHLAKR